jgi:hypothetical protein
MHYVTETLSPLSELSASDAPDSDRKSVMYEDNGPPHTARPSFEFFEDHRMETARIIHLRPISLHLTSIFVEMSKNFWPVAHSRM